MGKYRKRPVKVEARCVGVGPWRSLIEWCRGEPIKDGNAYWAIRIQTLEGDMLAKKGDWIIKGVAGEFYPCKPDIFEQTYEYMDAVE